MNGVGLDGPEARAQQRNAIAVRAFDRFHFFSCHFGRENARAYRQLHFQKWLSLIFDGELYFGERSSFRGHECGDDGPFGDRGEHAAVRKPSPCEPEGGFFIRLSVISKCGLHRKPGQRAQVWIHFLEVHALEAARFRGGQLDRSGAFDKNFAGFTLRVPEAEKGCVGFCGGD